MQRPDMPGLLGGVARLTRALEGVVRDATIRVCWSQRHQLLQADTGHGARRGEAGREALPHRKDFGRIRIRWQM